MLVIFQCQSEMGKDIYEFKTTVWNSEHGSKLKIFKFCFLGFFIRKLIQGTVE